MAVRRLRSISKNRAACWRPVRPACVPSSQVRQTARARQSAWSEDVMAGIRSPQVQGQVAPGFETVRDKFAENFVRRRELGGACCAYVDGEKVVDLWGGIRNKATGASWDADTMVIVYSATKGLAAMTLAVAHSRGWLDYDERVSAYWPEFAEQGKHGITVRQLLPPPTRV